METDPEKESSYLEKKKELEKRYGIDFDKLEKEQLKLAKGIQTKDSIDLGQ